MNAAELKLLLAIAKSLQSIEEQITCGVGSQKQSIVEEIDGILEGVEEVGKKLGSIEVEIASVASEAQSTLEQINDKFEGLEKIADKLEILTEISDKLEILTEIDDKLTPLDLISERSKQTPADEEPNKVFWDTHMVLLTERLKCLEELIDGRLKSIEEAVWQRRV